MVLPEMRSIQPAPKRAVELTFSVRIGSKSIDTIRHPSSTRAPSRTTGKRRLKRLATLPGALLHREGMDQAGLHVRAILRRVGLERQDVLPVAAPAPDAALEVAGGTRPGVEDGAEPIAARHRVVRLPLVLEQGQPGRHRLRAGPGPPQDRKPRRRRPHRPRPEDHDRPEADPTPRPIQGVTSHRASPRVRDPEVAPRRAMSALAVSAVGQL
jgi:hypothetical protein